ncbi:beta-ketoacyl synthase N-terminal-like domain-containing protein [Streptomyces sp. DSM 41527]|uniref:Beta-ketoacyl synthase N-terminal-like domain-containing protein n=1 Tax=Streptomyces mooreae TaxID=3075523 RepID=A0ABU2T026_9ACTN|nr:beta-ketoacyl synthase N-terminal-like domain-containing protein [Streptomyces sp. DSM 41527]MDT0454462.1 beta-ketoacyl synthase N-terminal-like domain-containing protein [Streptomyces sp. DSM 41527]
MYGRHADQPQRASEKLTDPTDLTARLRRRVGELLDIPATSVDPDAPLSELGLTSFHAVTLSEALGQWTGGEVPVSLFWEAPTLAKIVERLRGRTRAHVGTASTTHGQTAGQSPIAITGIGCQLPGATGPEQLWQLLMEGRTTADGLELHTSGDGVTKIPGSFLQDVDSFDASFFGISPREAVSMDPQQRLLLETSWEALEDAGEVPGNLAGSATGVFVGISGYDHGRLRFGSPDADLHIGTGSALSVAANRLSYTFDFTGPSMSVDTACSSSLVAVHLACRSLWTGEAELALAAGVNVILDGAVGAAFERAGFLAPDGRCKPFDTAADGYGRGEGCAVVVLKPLERALAAGDPVYAVIRSTAVNQDGRSNGLTAPSGAAQERLLTGAYRQAGIAPGTVGYIEAHGTGTALGDPIEARAIGRALGAGRPTGRPCLVGSVKSNLGHLEAAAGITGLVKAALCVQRRTIVPTAGFRAPNPGIDLERLGLSVADRTMPWPDGYEEAVAGVSSFGFGGTNAHVVLGEPPGSRAGDRDVAERALDAAVLLPVSAPDPAGLVAQADAYRAAIQRHPERTAATAYCAGTRRTHHRHRRGLVVASAAQAEEFLAGIDQKPPDQPVTAEGGRVAFVFSGQGNQWPGMGRGLLEDEPVAARLLEECDEILGKLTGWSLLDRLACDGTEGGPDDPGVLQPVLVSVQLAVAKLIESWGIRPDHCVGHSLGEVAAAAATGALSIEEALFLAVTRGELMREAVDSGRTALLGLPADDVQRLTRAVGDTIDIAAWNSPRSTLVAGTGAAVEKLVAQAAAHGAFARVLPGTTAFHSRHVEPLRDRIADLMGDLVPQEATADLVSTVTGGPVSGSELDGAYWGRNLREPVRFTQAVRYLVDSGCQTFVEIGAHPTLTPAVLETAAHAGANVVAVPTLRRDAAERPALLQSAAALYERGTDLDFAVVNSRSAGIIRLPARQWRRERFGDRASVAAGAGTATPAAPDGLLGRRLSAAAGNAHYWEGTLAPDAPQYGDSRSDCHRLDDVPLHLADTLTIAALDAATLVLPGQKFTVDVRQAEGTVRVGRAAETQLALTPNGNGGARITLHTRATPDDAWALHATATVSVRCPATATPRCAHRPTELLERFTQDMSGAALHTALTATGLATAGTEQINSVHHKPGEVLYEFEAAAWNRHAVLRGMVLAATATAHLEGESRHPRLLAGLEGAFADSGTEHATRAWAHVVVLDAADDGDERPIQVCLLDADGRELGRVERMSLSRLTDAESSTAAELRHRNDAVPAVSMLLDALLAADSAEQLALLTDYLRKETARVLRAPVSSIDPEMPMNALGLDSIMGLELHRRLEAALRIEIPVVRFLRGATTADIAAELADALQADPKNEQDATAASLPAELEDPRDIARLLAELDDLSEGEVDSLLQQLSEPAAEQS